jgi:organic radical activating enzyme
MKKFKLYDNQNPQVWSINLVYGCNLRCGHCCRALDTDYNYQYMSKESWINTFKLIKEISPQCRVDICVTGEPTLHPNIVEFLKIAKEISPDSQIQITTNGTQLITGKVNYKELLEAGANIVYTDMYSPHEEHEKLAEESGYEYYTYYDKTKKMKSPWTYYGDNDLKMIILQEQPDNWPKSRFKAGLLGTWYNNLDWEKGEKYNMFPVIEAPHRRCNQPFLYVTINHTGEYQLCCQDGMAETAGWFGSVNEGGVEGFKNFWFGKRLMTIRRNLRNKERKLNDACSRCNITFSRCDYIHWTDNQMEVYYEGKIWKQI